MNFSRFLDIQSWWEVPSIAYFCSLFRTAFHLLDFDIEELEEALLTDGTEESASSLITELIVRFLKGCLGNNDISAFNYQMYLRRLFRRKYQKSSQSNPFNTDIDFQFLPLRTKVEILHALCDFRLDSEDVADLFRNLNSENLRVEPLGFDDNFSVYWYFYGTRLYREDKIKKSKGKTKKKKTKESKKRTRFYGDDWLDDEDVETVWQVVCFTEEDWAHLTEKFRTATSKVEKELFLSLSKNFLPEIPRLFQEKERLQRKRLLELAPRRTSNRVLQKIKQKQEETKRSTRDSREEAERIDTPELARANRARRRNLLRSRSESSSDNSIRAQEEERESVELEKIEEDDEEEEDEEEETDEKEENEDDEEEEEKVEDVEKVEEGEQDDEEKEQSDDEDEEEEKKMPQKVTKQSKSREKRSKNSSSTQKGEPPPEPLIKTGRKTNNSLASATGQILIPDNDEPVSSTRKKLKTSQIFGQTEEDIQTDMYKVLKQLTAHDDAWPFMDPVEEEYAPNYYAVIRRPMDLRKIEERLDSGYYTDFSMFKADFKLIVNNCRLYNGQDNEYTVMVDNLQTAFDRLTEKYMHRLSSSDEEIAVEYQLPTPSRKHKLKRNESPSHYKRKKRKSNSDEGDPKSSSSDAANDDKPEGKDKEKEEGEQEEEEEEDITEQDTKKTKESHKNRQGKGKKRRKGHHRHGKHSKNHKKDSHPSDYSESTKTKHNKKQKHSKSKNKEGKKSKQKKKKTKHLTKQPDPEPVEVLKRSVSQESLESSNRSRSASPLPSIHTPTPSPSEVDQTEPLDQLNDSDFVKDKYDKIKERRRNTNKDAFESLFDYKQKTVDKQKQNLNIPEKDKNQKLRETIEKLKAKNEKYKDKSPFSSLFPANHSNADKMSESSNTNDLTLRDESEGEPSDSQTTVKSFIKKGYKKNAAKNESASEALEQAVKDISKWLDDAPKASTMSSPCDSPARTISTEEHDNSRLDDDLSQSEKPHTRKEFSRKRPSSREPKLVKRREIQRTIDRLQPGKSKGNLLTNMSNKNTEKTEEVTPLGPLNKVRDSQKAEDPSPKLSLGSVLPTVEFTLGNDHNFAKNDEEIKEDQNNISKVVDNEEIDKKEEKVEGVPSEKKTEEVAVQATKKDAEVETEIQIPTKPSQEKATPNLSAWFKAFGAPKTTTTTTPAPTLKRKAEEVDSEVPEKVTETVTNDAKPCSPKNPVKYDSPTGPDTPNPEGGDSPLPNVGTTPRQRRTSTGSSVSERSSFSQDLDSPRHQMSHTSPLLRSPASPRTEDFQKITYPIINGTVRAGFYQDTTSMKSSPEKSCSPREAPQSPYSPYSQHVYASNNITGSSTPNYFVDHTKSPLPTYNQNPPPFYDSSKNPTVNKSTRNHEEYTCSAQDSYQQNQYTGPYSPVYSPYSQVTTANYSQVQQSPQTLTEDNAVSSTTSLTTDPKTQLFPVKKRTYNETEHTPTPTSKDSEIKETVAASMTVTSSKPEYPKLTSTLHSIPPTSVDDIALALSEKSEMAKINILREKTAAEYAENRNNIKYDNNESLQNTKKSISIENKPTDMVNMGYLNVENDRRISNDANTHEVEYLSRDVSKTSLSSLHKGYDVDAIAINLGLNTQALQMTLQKPIHPSTIPPAHSQDRSQHEMNLNQNLVHALHSQYDAMTGVQGISNFSLSDIDMANKKLYACSPVSSSTALDYGNWKMTNQIRKQDLMPSDYSTSYGATAAEKLKNEINVANSSAASYNKNLQHQQYNTFNARPSLQRAQEVQQNLPGELRIPNPRGLLKNDHMVTSTSISDTDMLSKNVDTHTKTQKTDKLVQNHPLVGSNPYKTPYSTPGALPLDSLRNLPNIPQMLERYTNDERYLSSFANSSTSLYHDKYQMAQMFNKSISSDVHPASTSVNIYSQPSISMSKDNNIYKSSSVASSQMDIKTKNKRKRTSEVKQPTQIVASQAYHPTSCNTDVLSSVKSSMIPGNAFNFGTSSNMALSSGLYGDNGSFSIEDFRNNPQHQLMAANYMVAAVAHQQRTSAESSAEKLVKPAHQNSAHPASSYSFIGHSQVRGAYPFVGTDPTSPIYQQYLQRHQEELLRQTGAQIMSLYPAGYPASLGARQPYDINRPSWL